MPNPLLRFYWIVFFISYLTWISAQIPELFGHLGQNHQRIGLTNVFIVLPEGFVLSDYFDGIEQIENPACGIVLSMIPGPFSQNVQRFDEDLLQWRGMEVLETKEAFEGSYRIKSSHIRHEEIDRISLIFGDENRSYVLHGIAPSDQSNLQTDIKTALESVRFKDVSMDAPRKLLDYSVNEKGSGFQLATVLVNGMIFTKNGVLPDQTGDSPIIFFDKAHTRLRIFDPRQFSVERLKIYPGKFKIKSENDIRTIKKTGLKGFSILATNADKQEEKLLQKTLFKKDGTYYVMTALFYGDDENAIAEAESLFKTFKIKRVFGE